MSNGRVTVEWVFKDKKMYWLFVDIKRKLLLGEYHVGMLYIAQVLLTKLRNCVYSIKIAQYFGIYPPQLEEHISSGSIN